MRCLVLSMGLMGCLVSGCSEVLPSAQAQHPGLKVATTTVETTVELFRVTTRDLKATLADVRLQHPGRRADILNALASHGGVAEVGNDTLVSQQLPSIDGSMFVPIRVEHPHHGHQSSIRTPRIAALEISEPADGLSVDDGQCAVAPLDVEEGNAGAGIVLYWLASNGQAPFWRQQHH